MTEWFGNDHPSGGLTNYAYYPGAEGELVKVGTWLKNPSRFLSGADDSWSKQFHVFSVEWTPDSYIFRIDGQGDLSHPKRRLRPARVPHSEPAQL